MPRGTAIALAGMLLLVAACGRTKPRAASPAGQGGDGGAVVDAAREQGVTDADAPAADAPEAATDAHDGGPDDARFIDTEAGAANLASERADAPAADTAPDIVFSCINGGIRCEPYACDQATGHCKASCADSDDCALGRTCFAGGLCGVRETFSCSANTECRSGFCVDGVCCLSACQGQCMSCTLASTAGVCTAVPAGAVDPHGFCAAHEVCDELSVCVASQCTVDADCGSAHRCTVTGRCVTCAATCASNADCGVGAVCASENGCSFCTVLTTDAGT